MNIKVGDVFIRDESKLRIICTDRRSGIASPIIGLRCNDSYDMGNEIIVPITQEEIKMLGWVKCTPRNNFLNWCRKYKQKLHWKF